LRIEYEHSRFYFDPSSKVPIKWELELRRTLLTFVRFPKKLEELPQNCKPEIK
jgi:hypothetical protein